MQPKHVTVALFLTLVGLVAGQLGRVREWYMSLPPVRQFAWGMFALVLTLGVIARQSIEAMAWTVLAGAAALVGYVFYLALKAISKL